MSVDAEADQGMSVVPLGASGAAKHTVVGGPMHVAAMWKGIENHILKPAAGKAPIIALGELYSADGVASLKALSKPERQQLVADVRALLTTYATDDQLTGTPADVDTIVLEIVTSFWRTYEAAGGPPAGPEHIAVPGPDSSLFYVKSKWPQIDKQIKNPKQRPKKADELMHVVYTGQVVDQLALLPPPERGNVSAAVFDLLTQVASDEMQSAKTVDQDWAQLHDPLQGAIENGKAGLVFVRKPLLDTFGSFEAANKYYAKLTDATFAGATGKFIYETLSERIQNADRKLKELDPKGTLNGTIGFGGLSVRENRNQKKKLSNHSFGCAIDVNANENPNIPKAVGDQLYPLIEQLTGVKVYESSKGPGPKKKKGEIEEKDRNFTWGLTAAEVMPEAERLRTASDQLKAQFQDEEALKQGMLVFAQTYAGDRKFALPGTADADTLLANTKLAYRGKMKPRAFGKSIYIEQGPLEPGATRPSAADGAKVASVLLSMYQRFEEGQQLAGPEPIAPSAGDVTRFGFLNLDPRIVAALAGSDGGGLVWLGAQTGRSKDFMHFDLPRELMPPEAAMNQ